MAIEKLSSSAQRLRMILDRGLNKQAFVPQDANGGAPLGGDPSQGGGAPPGAGGPPPGGDPSQGGGAPPPPGAGGPPPGGDPGGAPDQPIQLTMPDLMQLMQTMMQQGGGGMPQDPNAPQGQPGQPGAAPAGGGKGKGMDLVISKIDELTKKIGEMVAFQQGVKSVTDPAEATDGAGGAPGGAPDAGGIGVMGGGVDPSQGPQGAPPSLPGAAMPGGPPPSDTGPAPKQASFRQAPRQTGGGQAKYLNSIMNNLMSRT